MTALRGDGATIEMEAISLPAAHAQSQRITLENTIRQAHLEKITVEGYLFCFAFGKRLRDRSRK